MSGCHQILTGACNTGDRSFCLGNVDSISFLAYASGCNLVILSFDFQRVQIIPGDIQISCVHCSTECGKIAAAYQNKIRIFEPTFSKHTGNSNSLSNYRWSETSTLECDCRVNSLSWDQEGIRLLMGGTSLQMWKLGKRFTIGEPAENHLTTHSFPEQKVHWECVWKYTTATEVHFLSFSPDSCLFATAGKFDRLVKIWYPVTKFSSDRAEALYDFVYLAHPRAVTGFSWRQTSKYMPKGAVFNALITSCLDKICRIWTETVLPEDGFSISVNRNLQPTDPKFHRTHKHRIMKRLQHVKACFHLRKYRRKENTHSITAAFPLPLNTSLPVLGLSGNNQSSSTMDYSHSHSMLVNHGACVHFHLAGSINAETDIPLVPPLKHHNFRVFWINNKEMFFTQQAEAILQELCRKGERDESLDNTDDDTEERRKGMTKSQSQPESLGGDDSSQPSLSSAASSGSLSDIQFPQSIDVLDRKLEALLKDWHKTPDILVSLHPIDGSFLVWSVEWLDEYMPGSFRQSQLSFSSCIPGAIPLADATSMSSPNLYLFPLEKLASNRAAMMTKHHNGTLNLWTLSFGDDSKFSQVMSVSHAKRASGHRFQVREMACHPVLPLALTAASHAFLSDVEEDHKQQNYCSELILWRVDPIGPLCKSGGIVEVARINSTELHAFHHVAWVPGLLPSTSLFSNSGCFVASDGSSLRVYQAVLDASNLLAEISTAYRKRKASLNDSVVSLSSSSSLSSIHGAIENETGDPDLFAIVSQQSTSRPGCILQLDRIETECDGEINFVQVFRDNLDPITRGHLDYRESFHLVLIQNKNQVHVWRIEISTPCLHLDAHEHGHDMTLELNEPESPKMNLADIPGIEVSTNWDGPRVNGFPSIIATSETLKSSGKKSFLNIKIEKLFKQNIWDGIEIQTFSACTGHFVCGSSYALISTSKDCVKVWKLQKDDDRIEFQEWNSLNADNERLVLHASAAYSGRIATVYKVEKVLRESSTIEDGNFEDQDEKTTYAVTVYECESTGGTAWLLEDTIELKTEDDVDDVHLEWVPKHDAQHILALAISDMVCLFAHVSSEPSVTFGAKALPSTTSCKSQFWLPLHAFKLSSADGLHPFPVKFGWIHAVCVVAMRNEMQVYSQWTLENLTDALIPSTLLAQSGLQDLPNKPHIELSLLSGSVGLFQYARHCFPVLPQFHPKQLMEMLNSGKVRWVKVILGHLVRCMQGSITTLKRQNSLPHDEDGRGRSWSRSRALSVSFPGPTPPSPLEHRNSIALTSDDVHLNYAEIKSIPPVPLWMLLQSEKEQPPPTEDKNKDYNELFNSEPIDEPMDESVFDEYLTEEETAAAVRQRRRSASGDNQPLSFGTRQARTLSRVLTHAQLPGLSALDQMHLLAVADTVASIGTRLDHGSEVVHKPMHDGSPDSLDDCGLRFLLVVKHYSYLLRCLPPPQRMILQKQGIATSDIIWAFHSESQDDILNLIPAYSKGEITWPQIRELGAGWWLRSNQTLRVCMEKLGKYAFQKGNDPMDAAIFYLAMKKKNLVWGLYRAKRDEKMASFFSNDFNQERWRKAALKNAYALLGKQRFEHAAGFFLLAGSLKDALEVCLAKLKDIQLALVVARLYDGGDLDPTPLSVKQLLQDEVMNPRIASDDDPFLRSMALWMLKDYQASLDTMLGSKFSSRVFNFYVFLRTHPLLVRQNKAKGTLALSCRERNLYFQTAHEHYAAGCPILAIHVLTQLPKLTKNNSQPTSLIGSPVKNVSSSLKEDKRIESGILDGDDHHSWSGTSVVDHAPAPKKETAQDFDWSGPISSLKSPRSRFGEDELKLDWEDDNEDEDVDSAEESKPSAVKDKRKSLANVGNAFSTEGSIPAQEVEEEPDNLNNPHTMISVELKLASCLKLMSEELVSMVGQIEGTELRLHLYAWLEKQVPTLKDLCWYRSDDDDLTHDEWILRERSMTPRLDAHGTGLTDILLSEKLDLEWKMGVLSRRSRWLRSNRHLLATLLAFGRLHAHSLAPVHIELVFLLDELQKEKSSGGSGPSLLSPLPLLHSEFPLLSAVTNPNKAAVSFIQSSARDILQTVSELIAVPVLQVNSITAETCKNKPSAQESQVKVQPNGFVNANAIDGEDEPLDDENEISDLHSGADGEGDSYLISKISKEKKRGSCYNIERQELSVVTCDWRLVLVLRDSGVALSSCLFQSLSDSEGCDSAKSDAGVQLLYTPRRRRWSSVGIDGQPDGVISTPDKWPGVAILRGMLSREEDHDSPKLKFLLIECYGAVFVSLFVHSLAVCDAKTLYRILAKKTDAQSFATIFGGGCKRQIKMSSQLHPQSQSLSSDKDGGDTSPSSVWTTLASLNKARMKFNMKLLGQQFNLTSPKTPTAPTSLKEEKPTYREKFVPPDMSIYCYLMSKPKTRVDEADGKLLFLDSDDEEEDLEETQESDEDEDDFWDTKVKTPKEVNREEEPFSYSWRLMRLAALKLAKKELQRIVSIAGVEVNELSHISPYLDGVIRVFHVWQARVFKELETLAPAPHNFLPNSAVEILVGPPIHKYRALLDTSNTPFPMKKVTFGVRRLWNYLVREECVQDMFIRFVFGKKRAEDAMSLWECSLDGRTTKVKEEKETDESEEDNPPLGPVRIVHKEHESISGFCINQASTGILAVSTPKEIQELDVGVLLDMDTWKFEDQFEFDLINLYKDPETLSSSSYLVVQSPSDRAMISNLDKPQKGSHSLIKGVNFPGCTNSSFVHYVMDRSRRVLTPILKHRVDGVRRMTSHSTLPLYLSGSQDGSVRLWEFSHAQPVSVPRPSGTFAKVTRIRFHGSKFGVSDGDGRLSLWQIGANSRPFYTVQCHTKHTADFVFLGSSSLIASAGMSAESKNVAIWDTLMPMKKAQVAAFTCHDQGCVALLYAEEHQCLISAGKKGAICIWDVRQRSLRHRFQGHENAIKCMCLDPSEEFFCTGSADGDIRVWDFTGKSRASFQGEHSRSGFFKNIPGQGVTQLSIDTSRRLFSCGADGSVKIRVLLDKFD